MAEISDDLLTEGNDGSVVVLCLAILVPLNNTRLDELEDHLGNSADTGVSPLCGSSEITKGF